MQNTTHYNLKKPDYTDFADVLDINDNMDTIDGKLAAPDGDGRDQTVSFTDADLDSGITSFPNFLTKIVSGMKMAKFLRDFKAGMAYVLHVGNLVNNATCTESGKALDARMGKTLQDQITSLNDSLAFGIKTYSCEYTISANSSLSITASQFGVTAISGYSPVAIIRATSGRAEVALTAFIGRQSGSGTMMSLRNTTNTAISTTATIQILYVKAPVTNFDA